MIHGTPTAGRDTLIGRVTEPTPLEDEHSGQAQSLATGAAGIALLHIERAHTGLGSWGTAHTWMTAATQQEISAADTAGLFAGAPAVSFVLYAASADGVPRYAAARASLDSYVAKLAHRRVDAALARIDRSQPAAFAEFDLLHGLTGIGQLLLQHTPDSSALGRILDYLVRLTTPLRQDRIDLPGWWSCHNPDPILPTPGGHSNFGIAHGITGPLALLAHATRRGITVPGQTDAITTICAHLDTWRQDDPTGPWWPQWISRDELRTGRVNQPGPLRPSWCYGTPGVARAQQLAAIAIGDTARQELAEHALATCLSDSTQLRRIADTGLCHGWAGLYQTAWRAAHDARTPAIRDLLHRLAEQLSQHGRAAKPGTTGLLDGATGLALALHTAARAAPPITGWDSCLLIN